MRLRQLPYQILVFILILIALSHTFVGEMLHLMTVQMHDHVVNHLEIRLVRHGTGR